MALLALVLCLQLGFDDETKAPEKTGNGAADVKAGTEAGDFDSNGVKIHYLVEGKGTPVVLIHGFVGNAQSNWIKNPVFEAGVIPELAKDHKVIAMDCRGHGMSGKPHDVKDYGPEMAEDVIRLMDHLHIQKAHLIGYSMGSMIASKVLATHADRLLSVTFGGGGPVVAPTKEFIDGLESVAVSLDQGKGIGPLVLALAPPGQFTPEQAAARGRLVVFGQDQKALAAVIRGFAALQTTADDYKEVKLPILIIHGDHESEPRYLINAAKAIFPHADVKVIEGGDHVTTMGKPEFRTTLHDFVNAHDK